MCDFNAKKKQRVYSVNAIYLRRVCALKKSLLCSHFEETIGGTATVRAYRKQTDFIDKCDNLMDICHKPWYQYVVAWRLVFVRR